MNKYENEYSPYVKKSPYADSPYECAYIEPKTVEPVRSEAPSSARKRGIRPILAVLLAVICCCATALAVTGIWRGRLDRMETAMEERFAALKQLYTENQLQNQDQNTNTQLPAQGPMTPNDVYTKNVKAVVAVSARYASSGDYGESTGSGFIISADGYVVTNYHVIEKSSQVAVQLPDGESLQAKVVGYEATNDVALLKVEGEAFPYVTLGSSDKLAVGEMVAAIGNPLGDLTSTLTVGYVSAKDRIVSTDGSVINMLQTDAAINAGNSGGPLFNMKGEVVGITTAKYSGSSGSGASIEGLGFAIPMDDVVDIISDLKEFGYVTGAYLGVSVRDVEASAQSYGLPAGAYVLEATKDSAAEKAGIRAGDIIVNLGGYDVESVTTLTRVLRRFDAGQTISLTVYRNGQNEHLTITLDEKPVETQQPSAEEEELEQYPDINGFDDWFGEFFSPFFGY